MQLRWTAAFAAAIGAGISAGTLIDLQVIYPNADNGAGAAVSHGGLELAMPDAQSAGPLIRYLATSAQVAALISGQSLTPPAIFAPFGQRQPWLRIPARWLPTLCVALGHPELAASMPNAGPLQLTCDGFADFQGIYATVFQALGFTYTPGVTSAYSSIPAVNA